MKDRSKVGGTNGCGGWREKKKKAMKKRWQEGGRAKHESFKVQESTGENAGDLENPDRKETNLLRCSAMKRASTKIKRREKNTVRADEKRTEERKSERRTKEENFRLVG